LKEKKMKKLVTFLSAAMLTAAVQAAAVAWTTGNNAIKVPNADGSFGPNAGATSGQYLATVYFFADNGGVAGSAIEGVTGNTDNSTSVLSALNGTTAGYDFVAGSAYWAQVVVTTLPAAGTYYTMSSSKVMFTIPGTGSAALNFTTLGAMPSQWTVVPEPTSMALLALGAAAIGLRRKFRA
jgi:hypothetical protein